MTLSIEDLINEAKFILTEHDKNNPYFDLESTLKQLIHDMEKHEALLLRDAENNQSLTAPAL